MNAKKIMGAVLVALLAAALFIGAGSAAITSAANGQTVFVNQLLPNTTYDGNWVGPNGAYTTPADALQTNKVYFEAAGVYKYTNASDNNAVYTVTVVEPSITVTGLANKLVTGTQYTFIPGKYYQTTTEANVTVKSAATESLTNGMVVFVTVPGQDEKNYTVTSNELYELNAYLANANPALGEYSIRAQFNVSDFAVGTSQILSAPVTFTVVEGGQATIAAAETTVLAGGSVKLTITGQPGLLYNVTYDNATFTVAQPQPGFTYNSKIVDVDGKDGIQFTMPATGKVEFVAKAAAGNDNSETIVVKATTPADAKQASVVISFKKGTITAQAEKASYFVGDTIKITGTSTAGEISNIVLEGNNFYNKTYFTSISAPLDAQNNFKFEFDTGAILNNGTSKLLDVGTYTLTVGNGNVNATVPITLKQPFINIVSAPEVIVQGEKDVFIIINAEATTKIGYYIFGNNFYYFNEEADFVIGDDGAPIKNQFKIELDELIPKMAAGQYFAVFQHPMNNEVLDVHGNKSSQNDWTIVVPTGQNISVDKRQTANAAQALCDALDAQGIDDMYVKATFFVTDKDNTFSISEIPTTVAQGETITISGVDTVNKGKAVIVEMLSSAFTAIPKEDENAAAFIVVTTTIADDGTWEVTLDTSALNVDEYNVAVKIAGEVEKTAKVNVVEAGDEPVTPEQPEQPEQPENPEEPVAPATPGFGALAALAGLGAVAVLLLRRE